MLNFLARRREKKEQERKNAEAYELGQYVGQRTNEAIGEWIDTVLVPRKDRYLAVLQDRYVLACTENGKGCGDHLMAEWTVMKEKWAENQAGDIQQIVEHASEWLTFAHDVGNHDQWVAKIDETLRHFAAEMAIEGFELQLTVHSSLFPMETTAAD